MASTRRQPAPGALPAAALFDWDGTLVDTLGMIYRANVVALGAHGITMSRAWFREGYTPDWRRSYRELGVPEHLWDDVSERWAAEMTRMRPRALPWARGGAAPAPAPRRAPRARDRVHARRRGAQPRAPQPRRGLRVAVYADDVEHGKPHPEALLRALDELGLAAADTVYVGDTVVDLEMARAAGSTFVAVGSTTTEASFRAAGVDPGVARRRRLGGPPAGGARVTAASRRPTIAPWTSPSTGS